MLKKDMYEPIHHTIKEQHKAKGAQHLCDHESTRCQEVNACMNVSLIH